MISREGAFDAALRGWHVFPCQPGGKRPLVKNWEHRASADPDLVARYWPDGANVGIATGPSGLVVIDLDTHGELPAEWAATPGVIDGTDVLTLLSEWAGQSLPATYWVVTPSNGWHLYFCAPEGAEIRNSSSKLAPMIDVRGAGGYVVGAGSVIDGRAYRLVDNTRPAPLPGWIARELTCPPSIVQDTYTTGKRTAADPDRRVAGLVRAVQAAPEGQRNQTLNWAAFKARELAAQGHDPAVLAAQLVEAACLAGLGEAEARRTVASGMGL